MSPGLKKAVLIPKMKLLDVAPFIVREADLSFPQMDGKLHPEFFE